MSHPPQSPSISGFSWGRVTIEGHGSFKDVKLYPGGAREWDWGETGTRHSPGIQPADVDELLSHGATVVVLGTGVLGRLEVREDTLDLLRTRKVDVHVLKTKRAVVEYNALREHGPVGALLHSTC
jgi:hypothetical protein